MASTIVFNLAHFNDSLFLPSAHIVDMDASGQLGYPVQRATLATIGPQGHELSPALARLLDIVEVLTVKNLEARFKPPKAKTAPALDKLLQEADVKPVVEKFIYEKLDAFLTEIVRDKWPLTLGLERNKRGIDVLLDGPAEELIPYIGFSKNAEGVEYRFQLGTEEEKWPIQSRNVRPLTNTDPAWLLVGQSLYRVAGINGNMVKPFRSKDVVHIPLDKAKAYFRQFVAKSAGRTRIEAEGFEMQSNQTLLSATLRPTENILEKAWYLQLLFQYPGAVFPFGDRRDRVTAVDFSQDGQEDITVKQVLRDAAAEAALVEVLRHIGLQTSGKLFSLSVLADLETLVAWMARHKIDLEAQGVQLELPQVDAHEIALLSGHIDVQSQANADWFDIQGNVQLGEFSFPFKAFLPYLRKGTRYFKLPDGSFFLIPEAWFARYGELAGALKDGPDEQLRLPKSLFTLLEASTSGAGATPAEFQPIDLESIEYQPSEDLKASLRPYQLQGVKWLVGHYRAGFGACLADDMGLGKTLQTIALLLYAKGQKSHATPAGAEAAMASITQLDLFKAYQAELRPLNALIILPASLVFNWQIELQRFSPSLLVCAHTGPKRGTDARALAGYDVVLTTYHTARQDLTLLSKIAWHVIVLDESQQIKNRASEVSKVVLGLKAACKVSLSGTPIENSLSDLWTQMEFINPATLGSFGEFKEQFLVPIEKQDDAGAKQRLFSRVRPFFLRRTKEEVAPDLPALTEQLFYTEMSTPQQKLYDHTKSAARNEILALFDNPSTRFQALQALTRLRQLANDPRLVDAEYEGGSGKFDDVLAHWDTVRRAGHKVLFFSSFEKHLQLFRAEFDRLGYAYAWLTGDTAMPERAREVARFQETASVQAFFMTVKAGGVGLNLTAADYVFLLDPWWNPAAEDQAIARAHRIGQARPVTALRFLARDTIEEKIRQLQERKKKLGQALFETEEAAAMTREDLEALLA